MAALLSPQELNLRGSHLLFRDKRHQLHVYDLAAQTRSSLLDFCQYVQWVPGSDVVVAQSRSNLCVWYSVKNPDRWVWGGGLSSTQASCMATTSLIAAAAYVQDDQGSVGLLELRLSSLQHMHLASNP